MHTWFFDQMYPKMIINHNGHVTKPETPAFFATHLMLVVQLLEH